MNPPIKDLTDYLVANTSLVMGEDLFAFKLPERGGNILCLLDTGGSEAEPADIFNPTIQLLARGHVGDYLPTYNTLDIALDVLHKLANIEINGTKYIVVWKVTDILSLGEDKKGRPLLSCNMRIKRT